MSMDQYSKAHVVNLLTNIGHSDLAAEAARDLPDPIGVNELSKWMFEHGLSYDSLISEMGGSPLRRTQFVNVKDRCSRGYSDPSR